MSDVAGALEHIDIGRKEDFYFMLRTLLIHRHQDLAIFDEAFDVFWRKPHGEWSTTDLRALGEQRRFANPQVDFPAGHANQPSQDPSARTLPQVIERVVPTSYSPQEILRGKDFEQFTEEEIAQARAMLSKLNWTIAVRKTRRWITKPGMTLDLRRVLRRNLKYAGEPLELPTRRRKPKHRPLVLLCDVSGSMERYSRMLLQFVQSVASGMGRVETFLFATQLTRVTKIIRHIPDWSGGTRIGEALRSFNLQWCRRVLNRGPIVLLISDGWDRGDPEMLRAEMSRLQRTCYRLIWLNPLLGAADYQPLTRGMQAALPFVDDFLPVHNLDSLEALARYLNTLPPRRRLSYHCGSPWHI